MSENKQAYKVRFQSMRCCVLIPTYNNARTIAKVIEDVSTYCNDIFIVNDGSTDDTLSKIAPYKETIRLIDYPKNQGKGHALITGFRHAYAEGFRYAVTIDSDGQHFADDLPVFLEMLEKEPGTVIIGARQIKKNDQSGGSNFANKFSNFWFKAETGLTLSDTQSGYRLYPLEPISKMRFYSKKYEFEIEVIVRLAWKGIKVLNVPIAVFYPSKEERISHFRPFRDFFRISILNTILVFFAFAFFLPRNIVRKYSKRKLKDIIKEDILQAKIPRHIIAISIGFGVFMGIVPIWGYQLAVGFLLAHLLKLNKSIFFLAANISIPPMIPLILYLSYIFGGFLLGKDTWSISMNDISLNTINLKQYIIGSISLAIVAGFFFGAVSYAILLITKKRP